MSGESLWAVMKREGVPILTCENLYGYDSPSEKNPCKLENGRLMTSCPPWKPEWREVLFHHFMSDRWPL